MRVAQVAFATLSSSNLLASVSAASGVAEPTGAVTTNVYMLVHCSATSFIVSEVEIHEEKI